jgi:hypothetical protein
MERNGLFDSAEGARVETEGWRAYYEHRWGRVFQLIVRWSRTPFHVSMPWAVVAAYRIARASAAWAPAEHNLNTVRRHIEGYYRIAFRFGNIKETPARAEDLELRHWDVHRQLIHVPDKIAFVDVMTELHQVIFGIGADTAHRSPVERVEANNCVDRITQGWILDIAAEWRAIEEHLRACYSLVGSPAAAGVN